MITVANKETRHEQNKRLKLNCSHTFWVDALLTLNRVDSVS